jgi:primosomal protein N''
MLKKAATQNTIKEQYEKLSERLKTNMESIEKLLSSTNVPSYSAVPDHNVLKNLL